MYWFGESISERQAVLLERNSIREKKDFYLRERISGQSKSDNSFQQTENDSCEQENDSCEQEND